MLTVQRLAVNSSSIDNLKANYDQSEITEKTFKATDLRVSMAWRSDSLYNGVVMACASCQSDSWKGLISFLFEFACYLSLPEINIQ